jgi:phosphotriesterase-related protein
MHAMTVLGPVDAAELGFTLPHEHVLFDTTVFLMEPDEEWKRELAEGPVTMETTGAIRRDPAICRDNMVHRDEEVGLAELARFRKAGGRTIVDVSPPALGRDPEALRRLSEASGLHIIGATGHYLAFTYPPEVAGLSVEQLAEWMIGELTNGIDGTEIRAGVIGELGVSEGGMHRDEEKMLRAGAMAQVATGAPISIHNAIPAEKQGMRVLRILREEGADLERVIMGHMTQSVPDVAYHRTIADTGATLEFDRFGAEFYMSVGESEWGGSYSGNYCEQRDAEVVEEIAQLVRQGYGDRILLSHDIGFKIQLHTYGGLGWSHVPLRVTRYLRNVGLSPDEIDQMTVRTPARLFGNPKLEGSSAVGREVAAAVQDEGVAAHVGG